MMRRVWTSLALTAALMLLLGAMVPGSAAPSEPLQAGGFTNTLRLYGREDEDAAFPYATFGGPFDLQSPEAPAKDFVVFNPALLRKGDTDAHEQFGTFFGYIKANNLDAHEKVHLRLWYQPAYREPRGETWPALSASEIVTSPDVVLEYTYVLLDDQTLDPSYGGAGTTRMVFPLAGYHEEDPDDQPGLDSYDVHGDGYPDILQIDEITSTNPNTPRNGIEVSAQGTTGGNPKLYAGDRIQLFDYMVEVDQVPAQDDRKVRLQFYYIGRGHDQKDDRGKVTLFSHEFASAGRNLNAAIGVNPSFVVRPFWITVDTMGTGYVKLTAHRLLRAGETFFVDGAEYDVAGIFVVGGDNGASGIKYLTLRNPIPKGDGEVQIPQLTLSKTSLPQGSDAWVLPPFNYPHDMVDDVNIPERHNSLDPDEQRRDNSASEPTLIHDSYDTILERMIEDVAPLTGIRWLEETKEERFDTNLIEEKFLEPEVVILSVTDEVLGIGDGETTTFGPVAQPNFDGSEFAYFADCDADGFSAADDVTVYSDTGATHTVQVDRTTGEVIFDEAPDVATYTIDYCYAALDPPVEEWQWINVATRPWDYTEFILPSRPDKPTSAPYDWGDYILVSSWLTEDSGDTIHGSEAVRAKFVFDPAVGKVHSADLYVNDAWYNSEFRGVDASTLRVYGYQDENAPFPYASYDGPFNIASSEAPPKDFVVFNPAFLDGWDYGIKADADADEKVHLRLWYVPDYDEPAGETEPTAAKTSNWDEYGMGDVVMEYTYLLLDKDTKHPTHAGETTKLVFPMAGFTPAAGDDPIGLDSYDVNGDGADEILSVEYITTEADCPPCYPAVVLSPESDSGAGLTIDEGETIQFLDFAITLEGIAGEEERADLKVDYVGWRKDEAESIGSVQLWQRNPTAPEADTDAALVDFVAGKDIKTYSECGGGGQQFWPAGDWSFNGCADPVQAPFFFVLEYVGEDNVEVKPYRWLREDETFFVDGAEYDVAKIHIVDDPVDDRPEFKYITLRNPLPKCETSDCDPLQLHDLTRYKSRIPPYPELNLPVLPPFDRLHDIVDDINVPETCAGVDVQRPDNPMSPTACVDADYDTLSERIITDVQALDLYWLAEEKEPRFDTNLLEEKFTEPNQTWEWINIETLPWDYTEFLLPEIPDVAAGDPDVDEAWQLGDYLLVSSLLTEDSTDIDHGSGAVRMKFAYDPEDGRGIYVNTSGAPMLEITKTNTITEVVPGETIDYVITVGNAGGVDASGVVVTDTLPASTVFAGGAGWQPVSGATGVYTYAVGDLPAGASEALALSATLADPVAADLHAITNFAEATDDGAASASDAHTDAVKAAPVLQIDKTDSLSKVERGQTFDYAITIQNTGNRDASGVVVTDTLPDFATFHSGTSGWTQVGSSRQYTFSLGTLAAGDTESLVLGVRLSEDAPVGLLIVNTAEVADDGDAYGIDTDTDEVVAPDIEVTPASFEVETSPDLTVVRSLTISNVGEADLDWSLSESPAAGWLSVLPASGIVPPAGSTSLSLSFDASGLIVGETYATTLVIGSNDPDEDPVEVPVELTVVQYPDIDVTPTSIDVTLRVDASTGETLTIENVGDADLTWSLMEMPGVGWLSELPVGPETVSPGGSDAVALTFDATGLTRGHTYNTTLRISSDDPDEPVVDVPVSLTVLSEIYLPIAVRGYPPCQELVENGGFESSTGWYIPLTEYPAAYSSARAHQGSRSMRVGIIEPWANVLSYSSARQTITLPDDAASVELSYYLYPLSGEHVGLQGLPKPPAAGAIEAFEVSGDVQYVLILDEQGQVLGGPLLWQLSDSQQWAQHTFDLDTVPYAGETVELVFGVYNDGFGGVTGMYVDDVSIQACYGSP